MVYDFKFPDVGEGITEGELLEWRVKEGDAVRENQVIALIETDKAVIEIPSPNTGIVLRLHYKKGDTVPVGCVLITIGEKGELVPHDEIKATVCDEPRKDAGAVVGELPEFQLPEHGTELCPDRHGYFAVGAIRRVLHPRRGRRVQSSHGGLCGK